MSTVIEELAQVLVDYLPGPGPGYPVGPMSFQGIAADLGLSAYWLGSQKVQLVENLLEETFSKQKQQFPNLIYQIIDRSRKIRTQKNMFSLKDLEQVNNLLKKLETRVAQLETAEFLNDLPAGQEQIKATQALEKYTASDLFSRLRRELISINVLPPEEKGYALELFLNKFFANQDLSPKAPFRQHETQVNGYLETADAVYCLYAFWQLDALEKEAAQIVSCLADSEKCLLISLHGFPESVKENLGHNPNLIAVDLRDLFFILDGGASLEQMIGLKARAASKGDSYALTQDLLWS